MSLLEGKTKGEFNFINEFTRTLLVKWCDYQLRYGEMPKCDISGYAPSKTSALYVEFAQSKGWVSKDGTKVLSNGFKVAAAFLRR